MSRPDAFGFGPQQAREVKQMEQRVHELESQLGQALDSDRELRDLLRRSRDPDIQRLLDAPGDTRHGILQAYDEHIRSLEGTCADLEEQNKELRARVTELQQMNAARPLGGGDEDIKHQNIDAVRRIRELEEERDMFEKQNARLNENAIHLSAEKNKAVEDAAIARRQLDALMQSNKQKNMTAEERMREVDAKDREIMAVEEEHRMLKTNYNRVKGDLRHMTEQQREMEEQSMALHTRNSKLEHDLAMKEATLQQVQQDILHKCSVLNDFNAALVDQKAIVEACEDREMHKDQQIQQLRRKMQQLVEASRAWHAKHITMVSRDHQGHVDQLREQLKVKEVEESALQARLARAQFNLKWEMDDKTGRDPRDIAAQAGTTEELEARLSAVTMDRDDLQRQLDCVKQQLAREQREQSRENRRREQDVEALRQQEAGAQRRRTELEGIARERAEKMSEKEKECVRLEARIHDQEQKHNLLMKELRDELQVVRIEAARDLEKMQAQRDESELLRKSDTKRLETAARDAAEDARMRRDELAQEKRRREADELRHRSEAAENDRRRREMEQRIDELSKSTRQLKGERDLLDQKTERQRKGIENMKAQLRATDARLGDVAADREHVRTELRDAQITLAQTKLETKKLRHDCASAEQEQERYRVALAYWENEAATLAERERSRPQPRIAERPKAHRTRRRRHTPRDDDFTGRAALPVGGFAAAGLDSSPRAEKFPPGFSQNFAASGAGSLLPDSAGLKSAALKGAHAGAAAAPPPTAEAIAAAR